MTGGSNRKARSRSSPRPARDQNEKDHDALERAVKKGKVTAVFEEAE